MKYLKIDSKGNIITGTTVILIASLILILIFVLTSMYTLENENEILLIEAGVNESKIKEGIGFQVNKVVGCIISHEHGWATMHDT